MKKNLLFIILFTLIIGSVSAQKKNVSEYFITTSGDSINGKVTRKFDENQKHYYRFESDNGQVFESNQISKFQTSSGDLFFSSVGKEGFARQILTGVLDLYKNQETFIVKDQSDSTFLLEEKMDTIKAGNRTFVKKNNQWIGILRLLTNDCEQLNMEELRFNEKYIIDYLKKYHKCIDKPYQVNNEVEDWIKTRIGISFGLSNNNLSIAQESSIFRYYPENLINQSYFGGIDFFISVPRKSANLSYSTGIYIHANTFNSTFITEIPDETLYISKINYQMLRVPLMVNYSIFFNPFEIMLSAGTHINAIVSEQVTLTEEKLDDGSVRDYDDNFYLDLNSFNLGLTAKVAIYRNISNSRVGIFASYIGTSQFGSGSYNNSQPYEASLRMLQFGIQIIR